jgi:hypothetical protein
MAVSPPVIHCFVSLSETPTVAVSIAVLKRFNGPHPGSITMSGILQSSHINISRVILPSFVLTFSKSIVVTVSESVCVCLLATTSVVITVAITVPVP